MTVEEVIAAKARSAIYERFRTITDDIEFHSWSIGILMRDRNFFLRVGFWAEDATKAGARKYWTGRKWLLSEHMTDSEVVGTAFKAVMTAVEHETREFFKFQGGAVFGPHISVFALRDITEDLDVRQ